MAVLVKLVSDYLTRILSEKLPTFKTLAVNVCTRGSFQRTDRVMDIDLYYTNWLIKFGSLIGNFGQQSVKSPQNSSSRAVAGKLGRFQGFLKEIENVVSGLDLKSVHLNDCGTNPEIGASSLLARPQIGLPLGCHPGGMVRTFTSC